MVVDSVTTSTAASITFLTRDYDEHGMRHNLISPRFAIT